MNADEVLNRRTMTRSAPALGRKGAVTRARLLDATRELLKATSPFDLTVAAICRAAATAPATLYVYFDDVQDVFFELSLQASREFSEMEQSNQHWFTVPERIERDSRDFVAEFNRVWDRHHHALQFRNLESDRGNMRFQDLRTAGARPFLDRLAPPIRKAHPGLSAREAYADAIVLYSSVERLAATRHQFPEGRPRLPAEDLSRSQARVIARYLSGR